MRVRIMSERGLMKMIDINFLGILCNVDSTILKIDLEHDFTIEGIEEEKGMELISQLENKSYNELFMDFFMKFNCFNRNERKIYVVKKIFKADMKLNDEGLIVETGPETIEFHNELINKYLKNTFRLMRLYKEGDIRMPISYLYFFHNGKIRKFQTMSTMMHISHIIYHIEDSEVKEIINMTRKTSLPFSHSYIQLAFENYEMSYQTFSRVLAFLSLMISLELLYNIGMSELRYRISRNAAVLLGNTDAESHEIFTRIKKLYEIRSKIVHAGKTDDIEQDHVFELRKYIRRSIIDMNYINKPKEDLLKLINKLGYNDRPKLIRSCS